MMRFPSRDPIRFVVRGCSLTFVAIALASCSGDDAASPADSATSESGQVVTGSEAPSESGATTASPTSDDATSTGGTATSSASESEGGSQGTDTGEEQDPTTVTITGKGFGTKRRPGPLLFDDFESGAPGAGIENQPAVIGTWQTGTGSEGPAYTDEVVRTGASASKNAFTPSSTNSSLAQNLEFSVAYLDYWTYIEPLDASPEGFTRNFKPFRFYGQSDNLQAGTTTLSGNTAAIVYFDIVNTEDGFTEWIEGYPVGTWLHLQFWLRLNDDGQSNGVVRLRVDDVDSGASDLWLRPGDTPLDQVRIGHYWACDGVGEWPYDNPGANIYIDDVYFDDTWARVEVGDAPEYANVMRREIQIPTSWTDTEITFELSPGTLPSGPAWAFVLGPDDSVLASKEIAIP